MYELQGKQAVWQIDTDSVVIRFHTDRRSDPFFRALSQLRVPVPFISSVEVSSGGRREGWRMQLTLLPGLDPFATVGAALSVSKQPFLLVGEPGSDQLLAQFHADSIMQAAEYARSEASPSGERIVELVPRIPFHIQTWEGAASCDASSVTLTWPGARIPSPKRLHQRREFALDSIARAEWVPRDDDVDAFLRIVLKNRPSEGISPRNDLHCLLGHDGEEEARLLLMAATITAHCRGRQAAAPVSSSSPKPGPGRTDSEQIYEQIRQLGKLHAEGILTDEEFAAKKKELLDRL